MVSEAVLDSKTLTKDDKSVTIGKAYAFKGETIACEPLLLMAKALDDMATAGH